MRMGYDGEIAAIQRRLADTSDLHRRRLAVLDAVALQPGERVLEVGCGGGALLPRLAAAVGDAGRVVGIDISADQIAAAHRLSAGIGTIETAAEDVHHLPFEDASFDALIAVQVIEYLDRPTEALSEMRRVSGASGRLTVLATNWSTMFWNCPVPELNDRIRVAWQHHAPHPDLPAELRPLLAGAGFRMSHQAPVTIINNAYHEDTFAYWAAQLISAFGVGRSLVSHTEAADWLAALQKAQSAGTFFFSSTAVLTTAVAV